MSVPLVITSTGPVPTPPLTLLADLINGVASTNPGYTANLPGSLIEDISSTDVNALVTIDQARVEAINNVTPYAANPYILAQLGLQFGIPQNTPTNSNVYVVFSGLPGYVITSGFIVSDGTYQYVVQDGAVIGSDGNSPPVFCIANQTGTWAIPANSVNQIVTSVPSGYSLTVSNPTAGIGGVSSESVMNYRARVLQAGIATGQATPQYLRTQLEKISGVESRLVSILQVSSGWEIICGGGDPTLTAGAIYLGVLDLNSIVGSANPARNITVSIIDAPNTYDITFVNPAQQVVTMHVLWNTNQPNFTSGPIVNQLAAPALVDYINSIVVGQPLNELQMTTVFQEAVASVLPIQYISTLIFTVYIDGVETPVGAGTQLVYGDAESYFYCASNGVTVVQ